MPGWPVKADPYYRCTGGNGFAPEPCPAPQRVRADRIESLVWDAVAAVLRNPTLLAEKVARYQTTLQVNEIEVVSEVEHLKRQLAGVDRQERKLMELYLEDTVPTGAARERLDALARQRAGLLERLAAAEARQLAQAEAADHHEAIRQTCARVARGLDRLSPEGRRELLQTLLDEIVVSGPAVVIHGALPVPEHTVHGEEQTVPNITRRGYAACGQAQSSAAS